MLTVHLPPHSFRFWLGLSLPYLIGLVLYILASCYKISLKPLKRWLTIGICVFGVLNFAMMLTDGYKLWHNTFSSSFYVCLILSSLIQRRYMFETLRASNSRWYLPWSSAQFSIPGDVRILVRDIDIVSPWYTEKLGLRKLAENPLGETAVATFRFKPDGKSVILTTRSGFRTGKTPIFFTRKLGKIQDILNARGVDVGVIEKDRQGTRYFQICDPEGNPIEVVEEV